MYRPPPPRRITTQAATVIIAAATIAILCAGGAILITLTGREPQPTSQPTARITPPPTPDAANWAAYIAALNAIDPGLVDGKEERAIDRGRDQCTAVAQWPDDESRLVYLVQQRFTTATDTEAGLISPAQAEQVLDAIRTHIC